MQKKNNAMYNIATFIVDKRVAVIILFVIMVALSVFTARLTIVESDLFQFLPAETETRKALDAMEGDFATSATARLMIENISLEEAQALADEFRKVENVNFVQFDGSETYYKDGCALYSLTFAGVLGDEISLKGLNGVREITDAYDDVYIYTEVGVDYSQIIIEEMLHVGIIIVAIVIAVLLLTSRSYAEVPVLIITFAAAAVLQTGTNFIFSSISYIANSITLILQMALAIDYAVILCNRFAEERAHSERREAMITALSKAIPEISASSLTTIGGLIAMTFMQFGMGRDLGIVLIKSILISMLTVFTLMPGLLMFFGGAIEKTRHRSFIPRIDGVGRFAWVSRNIIPPVFVLLAVAGCYFSNICPYSYNYIDTMPIRLNETQIAHKVIDERYGAENMMAVVLPSGDYDTQAAMIKELEAEEHVSQVLGIASVKAVDGYHLGDRVTFDEFAKLAELDRISSESLFAYYAARNAEYDNVQELHNYKIPLVDLFLFLYDVAESGQVELPQDKIDMIEGLYKQLNDAKSQLQGKNFSRVLVYTDTLAQSEEGYALIDTIHEIAEKYYDGEIFVAGNTVSSRDLEQTFRHDNIMTSVLSALFVIIIIIFTFRSFGLAVLLIAVIQGSIWINFSVPYFTGNYIFFMGYLMVSAIQMGANIDYAIVLSNRYIELRKTEDRKASIIGALNGALPTLITSGFILAMSGLLIGFYASEPTTSAIGIALGRGTIISLVLVMFVLPQILLWGDRFIVNTTFAKRVRTRRSPIFENDFADVARQKKLNSLPADDGGKNIRPPKQSQKTTNEWRKDFKR